MSCGQDEAQEEGKEMRPGISLPTPPPHSDSPSKLTLENGLRDFPQADEEIFFSWKLLLARIAVRRQPENEWGGRQLSSGPWRGHMLLLGSCPYRPLA